MEIGRVAGAVLFTLLLSGCLESWTSPEEPPAVPKFLEDCGSCFEPTVAVVSDTVFVTTANDEAIYRAPINSETFEQLDAPPLPDDSSPERGDIYIIADDRGTLWWSALVRDEESGSTRGVQVASSPDLGMTWQTNSYLLWSPTGDAGPDAADRQWVTVDGDVVLVTCTCPGVAQVQMWKSTDYGSTFQAPNLIPAAGRPGPLGPPVFHEGTLIAPYFVGSGYVEPFPPESAQIQDLPGSLQVAAVVSDDLGESWSTTSIWTLEPGRTSGFPGCCRFPTAHGGPSGFLVSWTATDGTVWLAKSRDGLEWTPREQISSDLPAFQPNAWPASDEDQQAVAWYSRDGDTFQAMASWRETESGPWTTEVLGDAGMSIPSDYAFVLSSQGTFWTTYPTGQGLAVAPLQH